jgi:predicted acetyltransferase
MDDWKQNSPSNDVPPVLFHRANYEEFLEVIDEENSENPWEWKVRATFYFLIENARIIGVIQLRHSIDIPRLREYGWHISYSVRPSEWKRWYATKMLELVFEKARELWIMRIMMGCFDDNIASWKTMEKAWGTLERYTEVEGKKARIYWVNL